MTEPADDGRVRRPWLAPARALAVLTSVARREHADRGRVDEQTWGALDAMLDELIEQLPNGPARLV